MMTAAPTAPALDKNALARKVDDLVKQIQGLRWGLVDTFDVWTCEGSTPSRESFSRYVSSPSAFRHGVERRVGDLYEQQGGVVVKVITYASPRGGKIHLTQDQIAKLEAAGRWPRGGAC